MSARFANQKLIVVGGTSGMGKAVARIVLEEGGRAVVIGHRDDKWVTGAIWDVDGGVMAGRNKYS